MARHPHLDGRAVRNTAGVQTPEASITSYPSRVATKSERTDDVLDTVERSEAPSMAFDGLPSEPAQSNGETASNPDGIQTMGRKVQMLQEVISNLEKLGVDKIDIPLPKLVVVGDQSAGKSSVIGGLAEIDLPRSSGTCTRCPAYIRTKPSATDGAQWTCRVAIQKRYEFIQGGGRRLPKKDFPLGPWKELTQPEDVMFATTHSKRSLRLLISRAQKAILNPTQDPTRYLECDEEMLLQHPDEAQFSPNLVAMEITGPNLPSLSFYDLPGIIQTADEEHLVRVVESLAKKYIGQKDAIILCALPMSGDPANSTAVRFIREASALNRCIGVLTKPDLLQEGELDNVWLPILRGEKDGLRAAYNWYATKQPGPADIHITTHEDARLCERIFFEQTPPWTNELRGFADRLGTENLRKVVSETLTGQINQALPQIKESVQNRAKTIKEELARLPAPPAFDTFSTVVKLLSQFSQDVVRNIDGSDTASFQSRWALLYHEFRDVIVGLYPRIGLMDGMPEQVREAKDLSSRSSRQVSAIPYRTPDRPGTLEPINLVDDDDDEVQTPTHRRKRAGPPETTPITSGSKRIKSERSMDSPIVTSHRRIDLADIRDTIERHRTSHLPGNVNPKVSEVLCLESMKAWEEPLNHFVHKVEELVRDLLAEPFRHLFEAHRETPLYSTCERHMQALLTELAAELRKTAKEHYNLHTKKVFTANSEAFSENRTRQLDSILQKRHEVRAGWYLECEEIRTGRVNDRSVRAEKAKKLEKAKVDEFCGHDPFDKELMVAGTVRGYYATAAIRFVDCVSLYIHSSFFEGLKTQVVHYLENKLELFAGDGQNTCRRLMEPNSAVALRRNALEREQEKLSEASKNLDRVFSFVSEADNSLSGYDDMMMEDLYSA